MSYGKKDEDADQAVFKVDRTSVFQEGKRPMLRGQPAN
jgi:coatomer protein complex subunit gamma